MGGGPHISSCMSSLCFATGRSGFFSTAFMSGGLRSQLRGTPSTEGKELAIGGSGRGVGHRSGVCAVIRCLHRNPTKRIIKLFSLLSKNTTGYLGVLVDYKKGNSTKSHPIHQFTDFI